MAQLSVSRFISTYSDIFNTTLSIKRFSTAPPTRQYDPTDFVSRWPGRDSIERDHPRGSGNWNIECQKQLVPSVPDQIWDMGTSTLRHHFAKL